MAKMNEPMSAATIAVDLEGGQEPLDQQERADLEDQRGDDHGDRVDGCEHEQDDCSQERVDDRQKDDRSDDRGQPIDADAGQDRDCEQQRDRPDDQ